MPGDPGKPRSSTRCDVAEGRFWRLGALGQRPEMIQSSHVNLRALDLEAMLAEWEAGA